MSVKRYSNKAMVEKLEEIHTDIKNTHIEMEETERIVEEEIKNRKEHPEDYEDVTNTQS